MKFNKNPGMTIAGTAVAMGVTASIGGILSLVAYSLEHKDWNWSNMKQEIYTTLAGGIAAGSGLAYLIFKKGIATIGGAVVGLGVTLAVGAIFSLAAYTTKRGDKWSDSQILTGLAGIIGGALAGVGIASFIPGASVVGGVAVGAVATLLIGATFALVAYSYYKKQELKKSVAWGEIELTADEIKKAV